MIKLSIGCAVVVGIFMLGYAIGSGELSLLNGPYHGGVAMSPNG